MSSKGASIKRGLPSLPRHMVLWRASAFRAPCTADSVRLIARGPGCSPAGIPGEELGGPLKLPDMQCTPASQEPYSNKDLVVDIARPALCWASFHPSFLKCMMLVVSMPSAYSREGGLTSAAHVQLLKLQELLGMHCNLTALWEVKPSSLPPGAGTPNSTAHMPKRNAHMQHHPTPLSRPHIATDDS